ncbi:MAG: hypothetical protein LBD79_07680 [Treponema sp.]|nr:hypothetical protein [Treponema sp.]
MEVSTTGNTLRNSDIATRIIADRSELRLETILSILTMQDEIIHDALFRDPRCKTGVCISLQESVAHVLARPSCETPTNSRGSLVLGVWHPRVHTPVGDPSTHPSDVGVRHAPTSLVPAHAGLGTHAGVWH